MTLNELATKEDLLFWAWARKNLLRDFPHAEAKENGLEAAKKVDEHQKRNAFISTYNRTVTEELTRRGLSWQRHKEQTKRKY